MKKIVILVFLLSVLVAILSISHSVYAQEPLRNPWDYSVERIDRFHQQNGDNFKVNHCSALIEKDGYYYTTCETTMSNGKTLYIEYRVTSHSVGIVL